MEKQFVPAKASSYAEIYQDSDLKFAFAVENDTQVIQAHDFIKCRDFFNEAIVASKLKVESPTIYGFKYPSETMPVDSEVTRLIIKGDSLDGLLKRLGLLNAFEEEMGWELTTITNIPDTKYLYLTADEVWVRGPVTISLYTHILRALYQYNIEADNLATFLEGCAKKSGNAANYQASINKVGTERVLKTLKDVFSKDHLPFADMEASTSAIRDKLSLIHNNSGIVSWCQAIANKKENVNSMFTQEVAKFYQLGV